VLRNPIATSADGQEQIGNNMGQSLLGCAIAGDIAGNEVQIVALLCNSRLSGTPLAEQSPSETRCQLALNTA
jgi:hypothetical protein